MPTLAAESTTGQLEGVLADGVGAGQGLGRRGRGCGGEIAREIGAASIARPVDTVPRGQVRSCDGARLRDPLRRVRRKDGARCLLLSHDRRGTLRHAPAVAGTDATAPCLCDRAFEAPPAASGSRGTSWLGDRWPVASSGASPFSTSSTSDASSAARSRSITSWLRGTRCSVVGIRLRHSTICALRSRGGPAVGVPLDCGTR